MDNLGNNPQAEAPQNPSQVPNEAQYAQYPPQGPQYPPQYAQAPQYAQNPQYPQYPQGQYGTGRNLPPKKKSVWPKVLLVGCGCLGGIALVLLGFLAFVGITMCNEKDPLDTTLMLEELNLKDKKAIVYDSAEEIIGKIHLGMPKDSLLMALGTPSEYGYAKWGDSMVYEFADTCGITFNFHKGKLTDYYSYPEGYGASEVDDEAVVVE